MGLCAAAACGYSVTSAHAEHATVVRISATPSGCQPSPDRVGAGTVEVVVTNLNAPTVSEIEIRTANLSQVLGERENLIEGLSGSFDIRLEAGRYVVNCPGAAREQWPLVVTS